VAAIAFLLLKNLLISKLIILFFAIIAFIFSIQVRKMPELLSGNKRL